MIWGKNIVLPPPKKKEKIIFLKNIYRKKYWLLTKMTGNSMASLPWVCDITINSASHWQKQSLLLLVRSSNFLVCYLPKLVQILRKIRSCDWLVSAYLDPSIPQFYTPRNVEEDLWTSFQYLFYTNYLLFPFPCFNFTKYSFLIFPLPKYFLATIFAGEG